MLGQIDERRSVSAASAGPGCNSTVARPRLDMSSTGMTTSTSSGLRMPASTMLTGRRTPGSVNPPRNSAISSSGRCVAERPIRCGGRSVTSSSRSSVSAR
jgi:hypothetical protein